MLVVKKKKATKAEPAPAVEVKTPAAPKADVTHPMSATPETDANLILFRQLRGE